jgi:hypothetical protein
MASVERSDTLVVIVENVALGLVYQALLLPEKAIQAQLEALKLSETASLLRYIGLSLSPVR